MMMRPSGAMISLNPKRRETEVQGSYFPNTGRELCASQRHLLLATLSSAFRGVRLPLAFGAGLPSSWWQRLKDRRMFTRRAPSPRHTSSSIPKFILTRKTNSPHEQEQRGFGGVVVLKLFSCHYLDHTITAMDLGYIHGPFQILRKEVFQSSWEKGTKISPKYKKTDTIFIIPPSQEKWCHNSWNRLCPSAQRHFLTATCIELTNKQKY